MDNKFRRDLAAYQTKDEEFDFAPSKKRAMGTFVLGMILFFTLMLILYTRGQPTPLKFTVLILLIGVIFYLLFAGLSLMVKATNKRYWLTPDAVRIFTKNPFGKEREDFLPLAEIAGVRIAGLRLMGQPTRLLTGGTVNHFTIELLNGRRYKFNDVPHGIEVARVLLAKVSAVRGVPWQELVGLAHERKALAEKHKQDK